VEDVGLAAAASPKGAQRGQAERRPGAGPRVALSGASSASGPWIARALAQRGFSVHASCPRPREAYAGRRRARLALLEGCARVDFGVRAEAGDLARWLRELRPALLVHHHHPMEGFRSPDYDLLRAREIALRPLPELAKALRQAGARGVVFSGSYFEPGEGGSSPADPATPYARSKRETWQALCGLAAEHGLGLAKVVIPNAIAPLEAEERLIPSLLRAARRGEAFAVRAPESRADFLPAPALAECYAEAALALLAGRAGVRRPSGWVGPARDFAGRVLRELAVAELGLSPCRLELARPAGPAAAFRNPERERRPVDWPAFWRAYAACERRFDTLAGR
jgi:nucleoside-diphosphate-sugar epimerase